MRYFINAAVRPLPGHPSKLSKITMLTADPGSKLEPGSQRRRTSILPAGNTRQPRVR